MKQIVCDLGFRDGEIVRHFLVLSERYDIENFDFYGRAMMAVAPMGWLHARKAAQLYWDEVYGVQPSRRLTG